MPNIFDQLKRNVFDTIAAQMGYNAVWAGRTARVLINYPSKEEEASNHFYDIPRVHMEYKETDFQGLKELIEDKDIQTVVIDGKPYKTLKIIHDANRAKDGGVLVVSLEPIN